MRYQPILNILLLVCLWLQVVPAQAILPSITFKQWQQTLSDQCASTQRAADAWIEELSKDQVVVSIYPQHVSARILDWVGDGGILFLALNHQVVSGAKELLVSLDLTPIPLNRDKDLGLKGAWPFPKSDLDARQSSSALLSPWLTHTPLTFTEGKSWLRGGISPIAIDELGRSLGYRVRYGKGTITLFGDGDALSDQLMITPENRRFSQSITWWLTKKRKHRRQQCSLLWIDTNGQLRSRQAESQLLHQLMEAWREFTQWLTQFINFSDHPKRSLYLASFILVLSITLWLSIITPRRQWRRRYPLRRGTKEEEIHD